MSKPFISMIWAMDEQRLVGVNNRLPWRLPADLTYFMNVTMGHTIIMGRKTFESFPKPLPGRKSVIITTNEQYNAPEDCAVVHSVEAAIEHVQASGAAKCFVIGGAEIYKQFLPLADRLYVTRIEGEFKGDTHFPVYDESAWQLVSAQKGSVDEKNTIPHTFEVYERAR